MDCLKSGFCYNILIKEGNANISVIATNACSYPLYYKDSIFADTMVFVVADVIQIDDVTQYVAMNDILVAVNGKCFGSINSNQLLLSWKQEFAQIEHPKLLTFFRFSDSGDLLFNPLNVALGMKFEHSSFIVGATEDDIAMLSKKDYCSPDIRVFYDSDYLPICQRTPSEPNSKPKRNSKPKPKPKPKKTPEKKKLNVYFTRSHKQQEEYEQLQQVIKDTETPISTEPEWRPIIDEKALLNVEVSRLSSVIDQCFAWNVFSTNSRPILNQSLASVRENIDNLTSERYSILYRAINLIQQSIAQYDGRVHDRMRMSIPEMQREQLAQITRMMNRLIRSLSEIQKSISNIYSITTGDASLSHQIAFREISVEEAELPVDALGDTNEMDFGESYNTEIFTNYVPKKVTIGHMHPDPVVETSALASVTPPEIFYELHLPQKIIDNTLLSSLQLETILYACQRHNMFSPQGYRYGFLLGDGAGVGKGRQLAGIIAENWMQDRHKAIWISEGADLLYDCRRDLHDIEFDCIPVMNLRDSPYGTVIDPDTKNRFNEGVLFLTYSTLISKKAGHSRSFNSSRFQQLLHWCGGPDFDGVIILDECHNAKTNTVHVFGSKKGTSSMSKTAESINELQKRLPNARIVYSSATGGSDEKEMGYMERLGLWGAGTSYRSFEDLAMKLRLGGLSFMEMLCCDMKSKGAYLSRQLSFSGCSFSIMECPIEDSIRHMYKDSVAIWNDLYNAFTKALDLVQPYSKYLRSAKKDIDWDDDDVDGPISINMVWRYYYSCFQRFFKHMIMSAKIHECIRAAKKAIKENKCVVIGLQSTGDSRTREMIERMQPNEDDDDTDNILIVNKFVSSAKQVLLQLLENAFPVITIPNQQEPKEVATIHDEYSVGRRRSKTAQQNLQKLRSFLVSSDEESSGDVEMIVESSDSDSDSDSDLEDTMNIEKNEENTQTVEEKQSAEEKEVSRYEKLFQIQQELTKMKEDLITKIEATKFPLNPLDELIDKLGGESKVAEMTGRTHRILHHHRGMIDSSTQYYREKLKEEGIEEDLFNTRIDDDYYYYEKRGIKRGSDEGINMREKQNFQDGKKLIAIISEAASAGISLHSDRRVKNVRKRIHIILELPWSADKMIQQCGRSHRSNQMVPPDYIFLLSSIGGELRFVSTLSKRLKALGALTQGSRNATGALDFSQFDYTMTYAKSGAMLMFNTIFNQSDSSSNPVAPSGEILYLPGKYKITVEMEEDEKKEYDLYVAGNSGKRLYMMKEWLEKVGFQKDKYDLLTLFFNRIMGLELFKQTILVSYLNEIIQKETYRKQQTEILDQGLNIVTGKNIVLDGEPEVIYTDPITQVQTLHYTIKVSRSVSYEELEAMGKEGKIFQLNNRSHVIFAYNDKVNPESWKDTTELHIIRPSTGDAANVWLYRDIAMKYKEAANGKQLWNDQWKKSLTECSHGPKCKRVNCEQGKAIQTVHLISGQFVVLWGFIRDCVPKGKQLRMVQVKLSNEDKTITGVRIQASGVEKLKYQLEQMQEEQKIEARNQEELTRRKREKEKEMKEREAERKLREKEQRQKHLQESLQRNLELIDYSNHKRIRRCVYGRSLYRDPAMPGLITLPNWDEWEKLTVVYFNIGDRKRDSTMPGLIALCNNEKIVKVGDNVNGDGNDTVIISVEDSDSDSLKNFIVDTDEESIKESTEDSVIESTKESNENSTIESTKESIKESTEDSVIESIEESTKDSIKVSNEDSVKDSTKDSIIESNEDSIKYSTNKNKKHVIESSDNSSTEEVISIDSNSTESSETEEMSTVSSPVQSNDSENLFSRE